MALKPRRGTWAYGPDAHTPVDAARGLVWNGPDDPGDWQEVTRTFRDGHTETWWAAEATLGWWGPDGARRLVVATADPGTPVSPCLGSCTDVYRFILFHTSLAGRAEPARSPGSPDAARALSGRSSQALNSASRHRAQTGASTRAGCASNTKYACAASRTSPPRPGSRPRPSPQRPAPPESLSGTASTGAPPPGQPRHVPASRLERLHPPERRAADQQAPRPPRTGQPPQRSPPARHQARHPRQPDPPARNRHRHRAPANRTERDDRPDPRRRAIRTRRPSCPRSTHAVPQEEPQSRTMNRLAPGIGFARCRCLVK